MKLNTRIRNYILIGLAGLAMASSTAATQEHVAADTSLRAATSHSRALPTYSARQAVAGELVCSGGDTMRPLVEAWARGFRKHQPEANVRVDPDANLSADGFAALLDGRAACVTFVREPFASELAAFHATFHHAPLLINVAGGSYATKGGTHALAIYVNAANPLSRLTLTQLAAVMSKAGAHPGAHGIRTWGQLGLAGEWATRPIHVYGMLTRRESGNPPGIVNFMQHRVLHDSEFRDDVREQRDRPGESALQAIVQRVAGDPDGIGYSGFAFATPGVKRVALAETDAGPYYSGSPDEVARRDYPLSRQIYLMLDHDPHEALSPLQREFLSWVLSAEGQRIVASDPMHFIPLNATQLRAARTVLDQAAGVATTPARAGSHAQAADAP